MIIREIENLMLFGLSTVTNNKNESNPETAKIVKLWEDYEEKNIYGATFNKSKKFDMYGVYSDYESDVNGDYKVTIAVEVTKPKNAMIIKKQRYLVFKKEGELPEIVAETWKEIWDYFENEPKYERDYAIDFEKYSKENFVEIYISIK
ncbi:MAG: GyrI-like domain-containing protein [Halarcobacter sp.]